MIFTRTLILLLLGSIRPTLRSILFLIGCLPFALTAQTWEAVYLQKSTHLEISLIGSEMKIRETNSLEKLFNSQFSRHSHKSIYFSDFDPIIFFEAETDPPNGGGKKVKVLASDTYDILQPGIFYGGYKRKEFVFPAISPGSIGRLTYKKAITDPHLLKPYYFGEDVMVQSSKFSIALPKKVVLQYKLFGADSSHVKFEKKVTKDAVFYSWTMNEVRPWVPEENAPSKPYTAPHLVFYIDHYEVAGEKINVLSDVGDLYFWYNTLIQKIPTQDHDSDLRKLVYQLASGLKTERDQVRAIFQWVQKNIRYVAFEDGMDGLIPRSATDVFIKRYGDCKDMANLLKYMINLAGLDAYHTWIGTRQRPYTYAEVPTVISNNHMICSIKLDNTWMFLDATDPFISFDKPTSTIQGKEALIGIDENNYEIVRVPVVEKELNSRIDTVFVRATENGIEGTLVSQLTGYRKGDLEARSMRASQNQDKQYIRDFYNLSPNGNQLQQITLRGVGDPYSVGQVQLDFIYPGYLKKISDKVYFNLSITKTSAADLINIATRVSPVEEDYRYHDVTVTVFDIPEGYEIIHLPAEKSVQWPEFGCATSYGVKGRKLFFVREIYSNFLYLPKEKFENWNAFIQSLNAINNQTITLSLKH